MTTLLRRAGVLAKLSVAVLGGALLSGVLFGAAPAAATTTTDATLEAKIVALTNDARVKNGCGKVYTNSKLTAAARAHSADMAKYNYFSHTGRDGSTFVVRAQRAGYSAAIGENIAWGYRVPADVMTSWMNSTVHRNNILNCKAKAIGVGLARKTDGTPYWTQLFGSV